MSQENVDAFRRMIDAYNRRDVDGMLERFDPAVEWHPLTQVMFGEESTVYRGHEDIRAFVREVDEAFADVQIECLETRDSGERIVVIGRLRARGRTSGAETESHVAWVVDFKDAKVIRMRDYIDPSEAIKAAGLPE